MSNGGGGGGRRSINDAQNQPRAGPSRRFGKAHSSRSKKTRNQKHLEEEAELQRLEQACKEISQSSKIIPTRFDQLPLSKKTLEGLKKASFIELTDIQAKSLPIALSGKDVLGAAKTGSGKTLAFLIPILEKLYKEKWGQGDGLGALIISPTRELAIQIFDVLRKIGGSHSFSAGLIIGGKDLKIEQERLSRMNIIIATPGRLLQHMDQTVGFETSSLQILALDEADRCMDLGFQNTLDAILENVPKNGRQTLLFSATQTKSVKDLARLNLQSPEYIAAQNQEGSNKSTSMPENLDQHYMIVPLPNKLSTLFSFIRTHLKCKILVFFSACRQVQFVHECFRRMRPGISLMALHGKQKQTKRLDIYTSFTKTKYAVLFATDIAARGLDFPQVDWVIQVDAPEDSDTYVHRVGRTARYNAAGHSLMFLLPSEEKGMIENLKLKQIEPEFIKAKESKMQDISQQLQSFMFKDTELKYLGQKAFISYTRSIYLQRDKRTFDVTQLPLEEFADSFGLPGAPKVKFVAEAKKKKAQQERQQSKSNDNDNRPKSKFERLFERKNQDILSEHYKSMIEDEEDEKENDNESESNELSSSSSSLESEDEREFTKEEAIIGRRLDESDSVSSVSNEEDEFIKLKRADHDLEIDENQMKFDQMSNRKGKFATHKKQAAAAGLRGQGEKIVFDDEGKIKKFYEVEPKDDKEVQNQQAKDFINREKEILQQRDEIDKERVKKRKREKKLKEKEKEKAKEKQRSKQRGLSNDQVEILAPEDNREDGYETPDFDLGDDDEDQDDEDDFPVAKRKARNLQEQEEIALKLLNG